MSRTGGIALVVVLAVAACSGSAASPTPAASPTASPTPAPTATPAPIPLAEIVTADASIAGRIGTYDIDGRGSDSPALPFDTLPAVAVGRDDVLSLQFVDRVAIGESQLIITVATDTTGVSPQGIGAVALAADGLSLQIGPLPPGRWVLQARLFRADGRGDGVTYWAVSVG